MVDLIVLFPVLSGALKVLTGLYDANKAGRARDFGTLGHEHIAWFCETAP